MFKVHSFPQFTVSPLTNTFIIDRIIEFFLERISSLFEDGSVKNYRFISRSYEFYEPVDRKSARAHDEWIVSQQVGYAFKRHFRQDRPSTRGAKRGEETCRH